MAPPKYQPLGAHEDADITSPSSSRFTPDSEDEEKTRVGSFSDEEDGLELGELSKDRVTRSRTMDKEELTLFDDGREFTEKEERGVLRKLDRKVVLFVAGLYLLSFLDRSSEFSLGVMGERGEDVLIGD